MVLCAGLGNRLRPLSASVPKPAVPVCGVPLVRWTFALLAGAGVRRVVVNVHHLPDEMAAAAAAAAGALGLDLAVSREPTIAGTGGALRQARPLLAGAGDVLLLNGDVLFDVDLADALRAHRDSSALATMVVTPMPPGTRYAAVEADPGGAVRRIAGAFGPGGDGLASWHFTGVHVLSPALLDDVPPLPFELDINRHLYPRHMAAARVRAHVVAGYWNDLGTPSRYRAANEDVLGGRVPLGRFRGAEPFTGLDARPDGVWTGGGAAVAADAVVRPPSIIGPGARIDAGATVGPYAVVGAGSVVGPGASLAHALVWEGTAVGAGERLEEVIAAGQERVPAPAS